MLTFHTSLLVYASPGAFPKYFPASIVAVDDNATTMQLLSGTMIVGPAKYELNASFLGIGISGMQNCSTVTSSTVVCDFSGGIETLGTSLGVDTKATYAPESIQTALVAITGGAEKLAAATTSAFASSTAMGNAASKGTCKAICGVVAAGVVLAFI
jgi:hypothetical protein